MFPKSLKGLVFTLRAEKGQNIQLFIFCLFIWLYNLRDFDLIRDLLVFSFTNSDFNVSAILTDK